MLSFVDISQLPGKKEGIFSYDVSYSRPEAHFPNMQCTQCHPLPPTKTFSPFLSPSLFYLQTDYWLFG